MGWPTKYTGEIMDSTLEKGRQMKTSNNGWIRMQSSESKPTDLNNLKNTGNYITEYWTNGPDVLVNSKIKPVNLTVNDIGGTLYQFLSAREVIFSRQLLEDGTTTPWIIDQSNGALTRGSSAPANPVDGKTLWLDSSDANNAILKLYINGEWVEIRSKNIMNKSVYDPQGKETDIYEYIETAINKGNLDAGITDMTDYSKHIQDSSIHITADELEKLKALPTTDTLKERTDEIKSGLKTSVETTIGTDKSKYEKVKGNMSLLEKEFYIHYGNNDIHPTEEQIKSWNNKADANHTHKAEDHTVKITYDKVSGGIPTSVMPYYVKERAYKIDSEDELNDIAKNPYHSGDIFYKEGIGDSLTFKATSLVSPRLWQSVCYGNGRFVAIAGRSDDIVAYSDDGITWKQSTLPKTKYWSCVCYGDDKFVAIASGDAEGNRTDYSAISYDGIIWEENILPESQYWYSVCYGDSRFVIVGATDKVLYGDGIDYSTFEMPSNQAYVSICYGKDKFVAITRTTYKSGYFAYSDTGQDWTLVSTAAYMQDWNQVCYGKDKFVAVSFGNGSGGSRRYAYSADGIIWTESELPWKAGVRYYGIAYGNGLFVITESNYNNGNGAFHYSTDGITWNSDILPLTSENYVNYPICYGKDKFIIVAEESSTALYSEFSGATENRWHLLANDTRLGDTLEVKEYHTLSDTSGIYYICYGKGIYIAHTLGYINTCLYSTDAINWQSITISDTKRCWGNPLFGNGIFVMISSSKYCAASSDGITWEETQLSISIDSACYDGTRFVGFSSGTTNTIVTSSDGKTWTTISTFSSANTINYIVYGNGRYVLFPTDHRALFSYYSTDAVTWNEGDTPFDTPFGSPFHVCYGNGMFIAVPENYDTADTSRYLYSTNGVAFTEGKLPIESYWRDICYGNGVFIALNSTSYTETLGFYSTDGITWKAINNTKYGTTRDMQCVVYGNNKFVIGGMYGLYAILDPSDPFIKMETNTATDLLINNAVNKPTSIEGYGITDIINKADAESKVNEIITTIKSRIGNHTAEEIAKVGYNLQVLIFANTDLEEIEMIFDYLEKESAALNAFASYPELGTDTGGLA